MITNVNKHGYSKVIVSFFILCLIFILGFPFILSANLLGSYSSNFYQISPVHHQFKIQRKHFAKTKNIVKPFNDVSEIKMKKLSLALILAAADARQ